MTSEKLSTRGFSRICPRHLHSIVVSLYHIKSAESTVFPKMENILDKFAQLRYNVCIFIQACTSNTYE